MTLQNYRQQHNGFIILKENFTLFNVCCSNVVNVKSYNSHTKAHQGCPCQSGPGINFENGCECSPCHGGSWA